MTRTTRHIKQEILKDSHLYIKTKILHKFTCMERVNNLFERIEINFNLRRTRYFLNGRNIKFV